MADICEVCLGIVGYWEEGAIVNYDEWVICSTCLKKVNDHNEKFPRRSFERCVKDIQKIKKEKIHHPKTYCYPLLT